MSKYLVCSLALAALGSAWIGCSGDDAAAPTSSAGPGPGSGGSGATGGAGAGPGGGGSGGAAPCLDAAEHQAVFTIAEPSLCVVAKYDAPFAMGYSIVPSWGYHDGPLTMVQSASPVDEVTLTRWAAPSGAQGSLSSMATVGPVDLSINETTLFMNPAAVDLPFGSWTLVGWAELGSPDGEAILLSNAIPANRYLVAGLYTAVGVADGNGGARLLHQSLTGLEDSMALPTVALWATDICGNAPCGSSVELVADGDASGVVALDSDGNLFATFPTLASDTQVLHGFSGSTVAPGAVATTGDVLFTIAGSGTALAALAPTADGPGLVLLQTFDGMTFMAEDVVAQRYSVAGSSVTPSGTPTPALTMTVAGTAVNLMTDDAGRLWLAVDVDTSTSTFFVLDRR